MSPCMSPSPSQSQRGVIYVPSRDAKRGVTGSQANLLLSHVLWSVLCFFFNVQMISYT